MTPLEFGERFDYLGAKLAEWVDTNVNDAAQDHLIFLGVLTGFSKRLEATLRLNGVSGQSIAATKSFGAKAEAVDRANESAAPTAPVTLVIPKKGTPP